MRFLEDKAFVLLLVAVSLAFAWILWPFYGAIFWATVLAIVFAPLHRVLSKRWKKRPTLTAIATLLVIVIVVIVPAAVVAILVMQEGISVYAKIQSRELDFARYFQQVQSALPAWASGLLDRFGLTSLSEIQAKLTESMTKGVQLLASHALNVGQNAFDFVVNFFIMLYLLFFFLRDGTALSKAITESVPLEPGLQRNLGHKFTTVIRATIKGNIVVAIVQGALGGLIFWILGIHAPVFWAVLMMFLSLLPAVGTALVWGPVAIYLLVTGATGQGVLLIAYGVLVIGLVDNVLRPILVGKDTKMPDYVVLISTLGGMAIFGFNGFVIGPVIAAMFMAVWDTAATPAAKTAAERTGR